MLKIFATYTKGTGRREKRLEIAHELDRVLMDKGLFASQLFGMDEHQNLIAQGWKLATQVVGRD